LFYISQKHEFDELELQLSIKNDNQLSSRFMFLITHQHRRSFLLIFRYILKWIFISIMYRLFCDYTSKDCVVKLKKLLNLEKKYFRHHRVLFKDLSVFWLSLARTILGSLFGYMKVVKTNIRDASSWKILSNTKLYLFHIYKFDFETFWNENKRHPATLSVLAK